MITKNNNKENKNTATKRNKLVHI